MADTLSKMRGRSFERAPIVNTVHVFNWVLNHDDCYNYVGTSSGDMQDRLDKFATQHPVLQAWHSQSTWRLLFDHADDYERTAYEDNSVLNWFRGILQTDGGLDASKMTLEWCSNVLRMVTPHMWIDRALIQQGRPSGARGGGRRHGNQRCLQGCAEGRTGVGRSRARPPSCAAGGKREDTDMNSQLPTPNS
jgi:hypothetical protein